LEHTSINVGCSDFSIDCGSRKVRVLVQGDDYFQLRPRVVLYPHNFSSPCKAIYVCFQFVLPTSAVFFKLIGISSGCVLKVPIAAVDGAFRRVYHLNRVVVVIVILLFFIIHGYWSLVESIDNYNLDEHHIVGSVDFLVSCYQNLGPGHARIYEISILVVKLIYKPILTDLVSLALQLFNVLQVVEPLPKEQLSFLRSFIPRKVIFLLFIEPILI